MILKSETQLSESLSKLIRMRNEATQDRSDGAPIVLEFKGRYSKLVLSSTGHVIPDTDLHEGMTLMQAATQTLEHIFRVMHRAVDRFEHVFCSVADIPYAVDGVASGDFCSDVRETLGFSEAGRVMASAAVSANAISSELGHVYGAALDRHGLEVAESNVRLRTSALRSMLDAKSSLDLDLTSIVDTVMQMVSIFNGTIDYDVVQSAGHSAMGMIDNISVDSDLSNARVKTLSILSSSCTATFVVAGFVEFAIELLLALYPTACDEDAGELKAPTLVSWAYPERSISELCPIPVGNVTLAEVLLSSGDILSNNWTPEVSSRPVQGTDVSSAAKHTDSPRQRKTTKGAFGKVGVER